jgi:hypothetical protein
MSYYILPKININYVLKPSIYNCMDRLNSFISKSLITYMSESDKILHKQLALESNGSLSLKMLNQIVHNYDFLFSCVNGSDTPVSKIITRHPVYFDIVEIYQTLKLDEQMPSQDSRILCFGRNSSSVVDAMKKIRENYNDYSAILDEYKSFTNLNMYTFKEMEYYENFRGSERFEKKCQFLYFEEGDKLFLESNEYMLYIIKAIIVLNNYIANGGCFVLKISSLFYKPIIDLLYVISHMFRKVYIMKPNSSNVMIDERYLVCKDFTGIKPNIIETLKSMYDSLCQSKNDIVIGSLLENKLHYYFLNKIEESNVIIGQQKLDAYSQLINLLKTKNKLDKIELMQKHNVTKCMYWCEKHNIPCNKFSDRTNVFVPYKNSISSYGKDDPSIDIDEVFFSYLEKHYGIENLCETDDEEEDNDIIKQEQVNMYVKHKS